MRSQICAIMAMTVLAAMPFVTSTPAAAQDTGERGEWGPAGDGIPPGWKIIEGCIVVRDDDDGELAATYANNFWPGGVIPYIFDDNVSALNQQRTLDAIAEIEAVANVDWRPFQTGDTSWVRIRNSTRNNSPVGRQGGEQILNMTSWGERFIIVHEMYHAMGFWHEQSRADRANYVTIHWGNIQSGQEGNFEIRPNGGEYGPYDFESLMHYHPCSFSTGCPLGTSCGCAVGTETITALPAYASQQALMGNREYISHFDAMTLSFVYSFSNWRFVDVNYTGTFALGTFFLPYKTFASGYSAVPENGTVWFQPGAYSAVGTHDKAMTLRAPLGGVVFSN